MLYKFKSRATADLIMLEPNGRRMLQIIGKPVDEPKGILQVAEIPAALTAIEAAIAQEEQDLNAAAAHARQQGEDLPETQAVTLRQRAQPFLEMLRRSHAAEKDVVWGV